MKNKEKMSGQKTDTQNNEQTGFAQGCMPGSEYRDTGSIKQGERYYTGGTGTTRRGSESPAVRENK